MPPQKVSKSTATEHASSSKSTATEHAGSTSGARAKQAEGLMQAGCMVYNYTHMDPTRGHVAVNRTPGGKLSLARFPDGRQCVSFLSSDTDEWTVYHGNWRSLEGYDLEVNFKYTGCDDALVQHIFFWTSLSADVPCNSDHWQPTYEWIPSWTLLQSNALEFQNRGKYYYALKKERADGPLHTIYLTEPQYLPCAMYKQPLSLLDEFQVDAHADDMSAMHSLRNWVLVEGDPEDEIWV